MCLIWGLTWFFLKYSLVEMPLFAGLSIRFLSAGIIFLSIHLLRKKKIILSRKMLFIYSQYGLINFSLCYFLTYWGAKYVFSNLEPNETYTVGIRAYNSFGIGGISNLLTFKTSKKSINTSVLNNLDDQSQLNIGNFTNIDDNYCNLQN